MMGSTVTMNVRELYFEHQDLMRINSEPMFDHLHRMLQEIKANVVSVPTSLGGGAHGYIGIILF